MLNLGGMNSKKSVCIMHKKKGLQGYMLKHYCIVWSEPSLALASMSMHTKLNICALIKQATFPH